MPLQLAKPVQPQGARKAAERHPLAGPRAAQLLQLPLPYPLRMAGTLPHPAGLALGGAGGVGSPEVEHPLLMRGVVAVLTALAVLVLLSRRLKVVG